MNKEEFIILMYGARRTGKTSILASMLSNFHDITAGTDIRLTPQFKTMGKLQEKREELENVFVSKTVNSVWEIDPDPTSQITAYSFNMNIVDTSIGFMITFVDIPGEHLRHEDGIKEAQGWLSKCDVVIVAIDTPHMMEENGKFNEVFNKKTLLFNLFADCPKFYESNKMILFVPLKCEKYYHENRMDEVKQAVRDSYKNIIAHMGNPKLKNKITMAITPILTMGDVVFSHFGRNAKCMIETYEIGSEKFRPRHVYYRLRNSEAEFSPKFCEQPLVYCLAYILKLSNPN